MLLLGADFETTGLDFVKNGITEVGIILWDTDIQMPVKLLGYFVDPGPDIEWTEDAIAKTGITKALVEKYGYPSERGLKQFLSWYEQCDYVCAHNGARFDNRMLKAWIKRCGIDFPLTKHWIDTNFDIDLPPKQSRKLLYMGADHGFLNPFPHRALFDVMSMFKIASENYDWRDILAISLSPTNIYEAVFPFEKGENTPLRDAAKEAGFRSHYEKGKFIRWERELKECFYERTFAGLPFEVKLLGPLVEED